MHNQPRELSCEDCQAKSIQEFGETCVCVYIYIYIYLITIIISKLINSYTYAYWTCPVVIFIIFIFYNYINCFYKLY